MFGRFLKGKSDFTNLFKWSFLLGVVPCYDSKSSSFTRKWPLSCFIIAISLLLHTFYDYNLISIGGYPPIVAYTILYSIYQIFVLVEVHISKYTLLQELNADFGKLDLLLGDTVQKVGFVGVKLLAVNILMNTFWAYVFYRAVLDEIYLRYFPQLFWRSHYVINITLLQAFLLKCCSKRIQSLNLAMEVLTRQILPLQKQLESIVESYHTICTLLDKYNRLFGWQILLQAAVSLLFIVSLMSFSITLSYGFANTAIFYISLLQHVLPVLFLAFEGAKVHKQLQKSVAYSTKLHFRYRQDNGLRSSLDAILHQSKWRSPKVTAAGFFVLDHPSVFTLSNLLTSFIISVVQLANLNPESVEGKLG